MISSVCSHVIGPLLIDNRLVRVLEAARASAAFIFSAALDYDLVYPRTSLPVHLLVCHQEAPPLGLALCRRVLHQLAVGRGAGEVVDKPALKMKAGLAPAASRTRTRYRGPEFIFGGEGGWGAQQSCKVRE